MLHSYSIINFFICWACACSCNFVFGQDIIIGNQIGTVCPTSGSAGNQTDLKNLDAIAVDLSTDDTFSISSECGVLCVADADGNNLTEEVTSASGYIAGDFNENDGANTGLLLAKANGDNSLFKFNAGTGNWDENVLANLGAGLEEIVVSKGTVWTLHDDDKIKINGVAMNTYTNAVDIARSEELFEEGVFYTTPTDLYFIQDGNNNAIYQDSYPAGFTATNIAVDETTGDVWVSDVSGQVFHQPTNASGFQSSGTTIRGDFDITETNGDYYITGKNDNMQVAMHMIGDKACNNTVEVTTINDGYSAANETMREAIQNVCNDDGVITFKPSHNGQVRTFKVPQHGKIQMFFDVELQGNGPINTIFDFENDKFSDIFNHNGHEIKAIDMTLKRSGSVDISIEVAGEIHIEN